MMLADRRVLLVDDNAGLREGLALALQDEGIEPIQAGRGQEALELALATPLEAPLKLVILDLNLPDMTGVRVYRELQSALHQFACIFMTAEASEGLIADAMRLNPLRLLRKPFEVGLFREVVRRAMAG